MRAYVFHAPFGPPVITWMRRRRGGASVRTVSEDQRVSRNSREPAKTDPDGSRRWIGYLHWTREDIIQGVLDLPGSELRRSRLPSGWSPIELLSHVLHMEQRWFVWGFLGERVASPWGDWSEPDPWQVRTQGC